MQQIKPLWSEFGDPDSLSKTIYVVDHFYGVNQNYRNVFFDKLKGQHTVILDTIIRDEVKANYPNLDFRFSADGCDKLLNHLSEYRYRGTGNIKNFLCSFNLSPHISRQLLVALLYNYGFFTKEYCTKNWITDNDTLGGIVMNLLNNNKEEELYNKFFRCDETFNRKKFVFAENLIEGQDLYLGHHKNLQAFESKISQSFLNLIGETLSESYNPFMSEKAFNSIVTRGIFLMFGQPGWYNFYEKNLGFKLHNDLFDYSFDKIENPVKRLIKIFETISKFSILNVNDLQDLYYTQKDILEYNYNHYFSKDYLKLMKQFDNITDI